MRVEIVVRQVPRRGKLVDGGRMQIRGLLGDDAGPQQRRGPPQPAEPHARRHDLGEAAEQYGAVLGPGVRGDPRHALALEAQLSVRVVLDDPQPPAGRDVRDRGAPLGGHGAAGGVLEGGDGVEEFGAVQGDQFVEGGRVDARLVAEHGHDARAA